MSQNLKIYTTEHIYFPGADNSEENREIFVGLKLHPSELHPDI